MGASVGIGALIMGVTLLSVFAIATTVISNQAEVALEISDPDVVDKPDITLSNLENPGTVLSIGFDPLNPGTNYFPGSLVFSDVCDVTPTGSFTVTNEQFRFRFVDELTNFGVPTGNYNDTAPNDGEFFEFTDLTASALGSEELWHVWFSVNPEISPGVFGTSTDGVPVEASEPTRTIEVNINEGDSAEQIRDKTISELNANTPPIQITWSTFVTNQIEGIYLNSGPVSNWNSGNSPLVIEDITAGGVIDSATLTAPNNGGSGCSSQPDVDPCDICGGDGNDDFTATMEWDYGFDITNTGDAPIKLSEIYTTINGGATEVLSSNPAFTVEYLFPGETITIVKDANSQDSLTRVAISSHGMNIAAET
ncbi:MAG: Uncharacterised protein [Methanobacteriota archaeon]|nr:MAG: Uncharacterised protein [Euryarchaeota archaeon]